MKKFLLATLLVFVFYKGNAQVTTNTSYTPTSLVNTVLLGGGVAAFNVTYTGYPNAIARFDATAGTNLGFTSGVYLTSGSVLAVDPLGWGGPDGPAGPSSSLQSLSQYYPGDADLNALLSALNCAPMTTTDAAVLEFDFIPVTDTIQFQYRFGSEEYNDYVGDLCTGTSFEFNDVFAFYLQGVTTPFPKTNIALIPGTSTPVSIYTVNNGNSFGASMGPCMNCAYYVDNYTGPINVVYDGLTTILTAVALVVPGQTYHIKLAVADAVDNAYDSGVFLKANSFTSFPLPVTLVNFNGNCNNDYLELTWSTSAELNNSHFIIEESTDLMSWNQIGRVEGNGSTNTITNYSWKSSNTVDHDAYYRLIQFDYNGTEHYQAPIHITSCTHDPLMTITQSTSDAMEIRFEHLPAGNYKISLQEMNGMQLLQDDIKLTAGSSQIQWSLPGIASGLYIVNVHGMQTNLSGKVFMGSN